jgi:hypothetical protein
VKRGEARPIHIVSAGRAIRRTVREAILPKPPESLRLLTRARKGNTRAFWVAEFDANQGRGYDLLLIDDASRLYSAVRRLPASWNSAEIYGPVHNVPTSRVVDVREVADDVLAVLIAQPRVDWKRIPEEQTNSGFWNRYESLIELIDVKRRVALGSARMPGFPTRILGDGRVATYLENNDATPHLDVWSFLIPQ